MELVYKVFSLTNNFPKSEIYGLTSQIRRSAVSIPSNIAEGWARRSVKEYRQFYSIAYGSVLELETQLLIGQKLKFGYLDYLSIFSLLEEVSKMLHVMAYNLKTNRYELRTNS